MTLWQAKTIGGMVGSHAGNCILHDALVSGAAERKADAPKIIAGATDVNDRYNLERFIEAQDPVYPQVLTELGRGRKSSHWMWFIFPQIHGLGRSETARHFAISSRAEAAAYLAHPTLGARLRECTRLVIEAKGYTANQIFGYPDDLKFKSSMTLFAQSADENEIFLKALDKYFAGEFDRQTLDRL